MKKNNIFKSRRFKHGTLATVMTIVFVAAIVLVNVIATILLEKFPLNIDLTKDQDYAMAEESKDFLQTIDREVTIRVMTVESDYTSGAVAQQMGFSNGSFFALQTLNTLKQCTQYNSNINLEFIDLNKNPQYVNQYTNASVSSDSIIVESDLRYKVMSFGDLFNLNYDNYYYTGTVDIYSSHAESDIIGAIMYVTEADPAEVVVLTNNSPIGSEGLTSLLTKNNFSFKEVNLLSEDIPADADLVLIVAPTVDYTAAQIEKLETFMNNGGNYGKRLVYIASYQQNPLPILEGYLANDWGIQVEDGMLYETNASNMYMSPYYGFHTLTGEMFAEDIESLNSPVLAPGTRPLKLTFETQNSVTTTTLITSSETTVVQPSDADDKWDPSKETKQAYPVAAASTRLKYESGTNAELTSTVVVMGSADFFINDFLTANVFLNGDFTVEMFNDLAGKEENTLNLVPKYENTDTLDITLAAANVIMVIFVIILPVAIFLTGLIIWLRRRHK